MAGLEERTGLGWRFLLFVPLSTLATVAVLGVIVVAASGVPAAGAFTILFGTVGAVLHWPVTLPGALVAWVAVWHVGCRLGLPEATRALLAACAAALGAVAGLWLWRAVWGDSGAGDMPGLTLIGGAAMAGGMAAASLLYLRQHRPDGGTT